jgi:hypothetical protein
MLDLDDVGAEVGQEHEAEGAGPELRRGEDPQSIQGERRHEATLPRPTPPRQGDDDGAPVVCGTMDPHRITSVDELRSLMGEPSPIAQGKVWTTIDPGVHEFIRRSPFLLLATADAQGNIDVSPKGDPPGFVLVEDERTLVIPDRKGNKLVFGFQNILQNPHVGIIFLVPGTTETLRVNGRAELTRDPALLARLEARGQAAQLAIRVTVDECFVHCAKAFVRSSLWKPASWPQDFRFSMGKVFAPKLGGGDELAQQIDAALAQDIRDNL